jgi:hypothetical protein
MTRRRCANHVLGVLVSTLVVVMLDAVLIGQPFAPRACLETPAPSTQACRDAARRTLRDALSLAGVGVAKLPIELASLPLAGTTPGVEAWTTYGDTEKGAQIFVYTESEIFRCASRDRRAHQCRLKLASIIVHEIWHLKYGASEADAYQAQIMFLIQNGGSPALVSGVHAARNRFVAEQRHAIQTAKGTEKTR